MPSRDYRVYPPRDADPRQRLRTLAVSDEWSAIRAAEKLYVLAGVSTGPAKVTFRQLGKGLVFVGEWGPTGWCAAPTRHDALLARLAETEDDHA